MRIWAAECLGQGIRRGSSPLPLYSALTLWPREHKGFCSQKAKAKKKGRSWGQGQTEHKMSLLPVWIQGNMPVRGSPSMDCGKGGKGDSPGMTWSPSTTGSIEEAAGAPQGPLGHTGYSAPVPATLAVARVTPIVWCHEPWFWDYWFQCQALCWHWLQLGWGWVSAGEGVPWFREQVAASRAPIVVDALTFSFSLFWKKLQKNH